MRYLPATPLRSAARLAALHETGLTNGARLDAFEVMARIGSELLRAPTFITAVEADGQLLLGAAGLAASWDARRRLPLDYSFCQHVVRSGDRFVVADARRSAAVAASPAIAELGVVAYAGSPWRTPDGSVQGAFCAIDRLPRAWTEHELRLLDSLATLVTEHVAAWSAGRDTPAAPPAAPALLSILLEQSPVGICVLSGGRFTHVSRRFAEIFGYSSAELLQLADVLELVDSEHRGRVAGDLRSRPDGEARRTLEPFRGRRRSGEGIWLEGQATHALLDGAPSVVGLIVDITARMRSEDALKESERRLRHVVKATNDIIWEWRVATGRVRWQDDAHLLLRYAPQELGRAIEWRIERIHEDDRERVVGDLQAALASTAEIWSDEYRFQRGDGTWASVLDRGSIIRDERGVPLRVVGATMDMTERRRSEQAQRLLARASTLLDESLEAEAGLAALARLLVPALADLCAIHVLEEDGTTRCTASAAGTPRLRRAAEQTKSGRDEPLLAMAAHVARTGEALMVPRLAQREWARYGFVNVHPGDGADAFRPASLIVVPLLFHGQSVGALTLASEQRGRHYDAADLALAQDLARRVAIALEHGRLYAAAQSAIRAREDILNMATHDLRNPLSTVRMAADLLQDDSVERREDHRKWLAMIGRAADRMSSTIDELRDLSRVDTGRFAVEPAAADGARLLAEVCEALMPVALQKRLTFECTAIDDLAGCWADERQIQRVFSNLVGNALKFTPAGGRVQIVGERLGDEARFTIRDNGPGIAPDHLPHIFDRYWQARQGDRRGVGLGLAIAKAIVEAHGGRIWADSRLGEGATFYFTIPLRAAAPASLTTEPRAACHPAR